MSGQVSGRPARDQKKRARMRMRTSFIHSDGWKWMPPGNLIQRRAPRTVVPTNRDRDQQKQEDGIEPAAELDHAVIVDERDEEHENETDEQELDLLVVEAMELGHGGGGADFEDAEDGEESEQAEESPVELAEEVGDALHDRLM